MRARYSAFVLGDASFITRTWAPETRPGDAQFGPEPFGGLVIVDKQKGGPFDNEGVVEFVAGHPAGALHERSRFVRRGGEWIYLDGDVR